MSRNYPLIVSITAVLSLGASLAAVQLLPGCDLEWKKRIFFATVEDKRPLTTLNGIYQAIQLVLKSFDKVESNIMKSKSELKPSSIDPNMLNQITEITSDIDFIYAELDSIRGSNFVKAQRKEMAQDLKHLSDRVDAFLAYTGIQR